MSLEFIKCLKSPAFDKLPEDDAILKHLGEAGLDQSAFKEARACGVSWPALFSLLGDYGEKAQTLLPQLLTLAKMPSADEAKRAHIQAKSSAEAEQKKLAAQAEAKKAAAQVQPKKIAPQPAEERTAHPQPAESSEE